MKRRLAIALAATIVAVLAIPALSHAGRPSPTPMIASKRFIWQQPLPQGNPVKAIDFLSDTLGWAVGDNGTVIRTDDGGFSWTNQGPIVKQGGDDKGTHVYDVCFTDSNNGWVAADGMVYRTTNGGSTWGNSGAWMAGNDGKYYAYRSVDFADANNGWMIGSYKIFRTTNGGATVSQQTIPATATPTQVIAVSSAEAFAHGYPSVGYLSTTDGGSTWNQRQFTGTAHENDPPWTMAACSASTVYAVSGGDLLKTANGGSTWTTVTVTGLDSGDVAWQVAAVDGDTSGLSIYVLTDGHDLFKSSDGGDTWTKKLDRTGPDVLEAPSATGLFAVDGWGVVGSPDGGGSWYECDEGTTSNPYRAVDFSTESTGHAITPYEYARTTDGGANWDVFDLAATGINLDQMSDMTFLQSDPQMGWIVGNPAGGSGLPSVYKTTDAGQTWTSLEETRMADIQRVRFSDANNGWAIYPYQDGFWHSSDGGNAWQKVPHAGSHWDIDFADADNGWIAYTPMVNTDLCIAHTADGGSTWTTQTVGNTGGSLQYIDFADANTGYAVDTFANIFKTTNGGDTWAEIEFWPYSPDFRIHDIKFSTPLDGWVVGKQKTSTVIPSDRHDFAAHTTDGGQTWDFYADAEASDYGSTGTNVGISALDAVGSKMWFVGGNGSIVTTRPRAVASITSPSKTLATYGQSAVVTGTLALEGAPLAGKRIDLWTASSPSGPYAKSAAGATTATDGTFSITVTPSNATYYKARFGGDATDRDSALSAAAVKITPAPSMGNPIAPAKMKRSKYYTVYGYLKPRHASGSYPVRVHLYRYVSGKWKSYGYVKAKASNYSSYTKYSAKLRLTKRGKWRLGAVHPADSGHATGWSSGYDYVRVQ